MSSEVANFNHEKIMAQIKKPDTEDILLIRTSEDGTVETWSSADDEESFHLVLDAVELYAENLDLTVNIKIDYP